MSSGAQKSSAAQLGRRSSTAPTWRQSCVSPERSTGNAGSQLPDVAVAYQPCPARRIDGSGWSPGITGFASAGAERAQRNQHCGAAAATTLG